MPRRNGNPLNKKRINIKQSIYIIADSFSIPNERKSSVFTMRRYGHRNALHVTPIASKPHLRLKNIKARLDNGSERHAWSEVQWNKVALIEEEIFTLLLLKSYLRVRCWEGIMYQTKNIAPSSTSDFVRLCV